MNAAAVPHPASAGRSGGEILVAALLAHGIDRAFGVPGESAMPLYDALLTNANRIQFVTCRHEATAAHMAEADGKLRNGPGLCLVSRGPGAMHAAVGVHMAVQNSTPMILIVGQVPRDVRGREAFQEMEYDQIFASTAKWAVEIDDPQRIPETFARAVQISRSGRPGPVVISIPEDVFDETCMVEDMPPLAVESPAPTAAHLGRVRELLQGAERPVVIIGGSGWTPQDAQSVLGFATANELPIVAAFRSQGIVGFREENYCGDLGFGVSPALAARIKSADVILAIGDRLCDITTQGYQLIEAPEPKQRLIHVYPGAEELGRVFRAELPIHSGIAPFVAALGDLRLAPHAGWTEWRQAMRREFLAFKTPGPLRQGLDMSRVVAFLNERLPDDAIVTNGAGNYGGWVHRYYQYRSFGAQIAPKGGSMGYGFPAALAAKLRHPERMVVCFAGDGCFSMAMVELATAMQNRIPVVVLVINNGMYGAIRFHQERQFPGRPIGTTLHNPNFAELARSFGAFGEVVESHETFPAAFERAVASQGPAVIELRVDPDLLTPDKTVADVRAMART